MNKVWKVVRDVVLTICCLTTLLVGVVMVTNFDHVQKIARTLVLIDQRYLGDTDADTLTNGAVKGMLDSLGDKYTTYIDAETMTGFMQQVSGDVYGIGIYVAEDEAGQYVILAPMKESPAEAAGVQAGDILTAVDGMSCTELGSLDAAVNKMRGLPDTTVDITVRREGQEHTYTVKRYKLGQIKTVEGTLLKENQDIAYLRISEFSVQTATEFAEQINTLLKDGFKGVILDLRDNGGGEVNSAVEVARIFVQSGPIVPVVVLINENTASASEILAGALKDSGAATLVGTQSFGKGLVQGVYLYNDGTAMKITEAKYLTPNKNDINGVGIKPDVTIELPEKATTDVQLQKAITVLENKM